MQEEYETKHADLMNRWIEDYRKSDQELSFAKDGIVDPQTWFSLGDNEEKIMFLLKEAYEVGEKTVWDQTKWLSKKTGERCNDKCTKNCDECDITGYTFNPIVECVYGINQIEQGKTYKYDNWIGLTENDKGEKFVDKRAELLKRITIINIKKAFGGKSSAIDDLYYHTAKDKDLLKEQVELINPTLIICGGTYGMLRCLYTELQELEDNSNGFAHNDKFDVIASCHPSKRCLGKLKCDNVVNNYIRLREFKK